MKNKNNILIILTILIISNNIILKASDISVYDINITATANPQFTMRTFIENMEEDNYKPDLALRTMSFSSRNTQNKKSLVIKLKKIFDAKGIVFNISNISLDKNFIDSTSMTHIYKLSNELPDIYLSKVNDKWLFSEHSTDNIEKIYKKLYPFNLNEYIENLPEVFKTSFLWLKLWQIIGLAVLIILSYFVVIIFKFIIKKILLQILKHLKRGNAANSFALPISKRISALVGIIVFIGFLPVLELPNSLNRTIVFISKIVIPIYIVLTAFKFIDALSVVFKLIANSTQNTVDDVLVPFFRKGLKIVFLIFAIFYTLDMFNINITPLLAGVSIGGLAFALAAQETVKNMLGSFTIFMDKPFSIGDWIRFPGVDGSVEDIGVRSTRIRTFDNSLITVPNGKLMDMVIDNPGMRKMRRYKCDIQISYKTPSYITKEFTKGLRELAEKNENIYSEEIEISFYNYGAYSLDIRHSVFFKVPNFMAELKAREEYNLQIYELAEKLGVEFAYPTQSIYIENNDNLGDNDTFIIPDKSTEIRNDKFIKEYREDLNKKTE